MSGADPELQRLLLEELKRHVVALESQPFDRDAAQRAVHALKGSAGLAGQKELAAALERLHRRVRDGDEVALADAAAVVRTAITRMGAGESAVAIKWPEPPPDLDVRPLDPLVRVQYVAELTDRLARVDEALASRGEPLDAVAVAYRQIHTMKGAASAVGDEAMSWFCHGLEERLKAAGTREQATAVLQQVAHWRAVLGGLLDDPESALRTLRGPAGKSSQAPRGIVRPYDDEPPRSFAPGSDEATIRVSAASVDRLLDRFEAIDLVRERIALRAESARDVSRMLRQLRGGLIEALRLIGPPRPWGAPAAALRKVEEVISALGPISEDVEQTHGSLRGAGLALKDDVADAKKQLSTMRQTPVGRLFARLANAVEAEARRNDRAVIVSTRGADETIDRRLAEQLVEPCLQLVRNAVAHGIEPVSVRLAAGKPPSGTIALTARRVGHRLSIIIKDDGAGVDVADVRRRAVEAGAVAPDLADAADDETLLTLLFLPGFSTRESSDLLAGRGIGLDISRSSIQRMGGAIHLSSRAGEGFAARIDVPIESGLTSVLWVHAGGEEYAIPVTSAMDVQKNDGLDAARVPHLASCLEVRPNERAAFAIAVSAGHAGHLDADVDERDVALVTPVLLGVDAVGRMEEMLLRPLTPLVAGLGPFVGAIARGDGSVRLAIDVHAIIPRARALVRGANTREASSERPPASSRAGRSA